MTEEDGKEEGSSSEGQGIRGDLWQGVRSPVPAWLLFPSSPQVRGQLSVSSYSLPLSMCQVPLHSAPAPLGGSLLLLHLLGAGSLQDPKVIVLFGHSKFEATHGVVEAKGGILGSQGAGEHSHDGVQGSEVRVAAVLGSPTVVSSTPCRQPMSLFEPLDLGTRHGKLSEEFIRLGPGDAFGEICHL